MEVFTWKGVGDLRGRRRRIRQYQTEADAALLHPRLPRDFLHDLVAEANLTRPVVPTRSAPHRS